MASSSTGLQVEPQPAQNELFGAVQSCADAAGLTVRVATTADAAALNQAHLRFTMEMQSWNPRNKNDSVRSPALASVPSRPRARDGGFATSISGDNVGACARGHPLALLGSAYAETFDKPIRFAQVPDSDASGIKSLIEDEPECIILLTRELVDCACSQVVGFVYSYDDGPTAATADGAAERRRSIRRHSGSGTAERSCYIAEVYIEPPDRGRGLGEILVGASLAAALKRRTNDVHLYVTHRNHAAVRLYEKIGFKDVGESSDAVHDRLMKIGDLSSLTLPAKVLRARAAKHAGAGDGRRTTRSVGGVRKPPPMLPASPFHPGKGKSKGQSKGKRQVCLRDSLTSYLRFFF